MPTAGQRQATAPGPRGSLLLGVARELRRGTSSAPSNEPRPRTATWPAWSPDLPDGGSASTW
jgi:hypothetical protein